MLEVAVHFTVRRTEVQYLEFTPGFGSTWDFTSGETLCVTTVVVILHAAKNCRTGATHDMAPQTQ